MTKKQLSRRQFLRGSLAATVLASTAVGGACPANERVNVGVIGTGIRGKYLIGNMPDEARVVAICDSFLPRVADTLKPREPYATVLAKFSAQQAAHCATYQDYRKLLEHPKLDAVVIATSDHHHILPAILACQAGLDVYLEKPMTLTIGEGRALIAAVSRYKRILQVGTQQRSMEMNQFASQFIRDGGLGRIRFVQMPNFPGPMLYRGLPEEPVPPGLNWDLFCGPTPLRPHHRRLWVKDEFQVDGKLWRGWDLWRDYSGHLMTNWGAHLVDLVQWALGTDDTGPVAIWPLDKDYRGESRLRPVAMRYASGIELRFDGKDRSGAIFHGERGTMEVTRNRFQVNPPELVKNPPDPRVVDVWQGPGHVARPHIQNWLDCLKSRRTPRASVTMGHRSVTICHLANIVRELGRPLRWDPVKETFPDDAEANALLDRPRRQGYELPRL